MRLPFIYTRPLFSLLLFLVSIPSFAQQWNTKSPYLKEARIETSAGVTPLQLPEHTAILAYQPDAEYKRAGLPIIILNEKDTLHFQTDDEGESSVTRYFVHIKPTDALNIQIVGRLYSGRLQAVVVPPVTPKQRQRYMDAKKERGGPRARCTLPPSIDQSIWREGLPAPKNTVDFTRAKFVFVHHTETPNSDTDYMARVRAIYIFHTEVRGWDDIGYNFLVAPDGTIFQGRDGRGYFEDDYAKGAHLCGKNDNTFGVAMIGDYMKVKPSDTLIGSLAAVITYKMGKEGIRPMDRARHPINDSAAPLYYRLSGHRDGCPTNCPGDSGYAILPALRSRVEAAVAHCDPYLNTNATANTAVKARVYPNPATDYLFLSGEFGPGLFSYSVSDLAGRVFITGSFSGMPPRIDLRNIPTGRYQLSINDTKERIATQIPFRILR